MYTQISRYMLARTREQLFPGEGRLEVAAGETFVREPLPPTPLRGVVRANNCEIRRNSVSRNGLRYGDLFYFGAWRRWRTGRGGRSVASSSADERNRTEPLNCAAAAAAADSQWSELSSSRCVVELRSPTVRWNVRVNPFADSLPCTRFVFWRISRAVFYVSRSPACPSSTVSATKMDSFMLNNNKWVLIIDNNGLTETDNAILLRLVPAFRAPHHHVLPIALVF